MHALLALLTACKIPRLQLYLPALACLQAPGDLQGRVHGAAAGAVTRPDCRAGLLLSRLPTEASATGTTECVAELPSLLFSYIAYKRPINCLCDVIGLFDQLLTQVQSLHPCS